MDFPLSFLKVAVAWVTPSTVLLGLWAPPPYNIHSLPCVCTLPARHLFPHKAPSAKGIIPEVRSNSFTGTQSLLNTDTMG